MNSITKEELKELQKISIEMAEYFVDFCNNHELTCYLCGGGCIGAIRHKGMIPWDDDLDFFMPRNDYEKMITIWKSEENENSRYILEKSDEKHIDHNLFVTIRDAKTTLIKSYQKNLDITHGVSLDVLPLDGYPNNFLQRKFQCFWALIYSLYCAQLVPANHGKLISCLGSLALHMVPIKKIRYKIWRFAEKRMSKYQINECNGITELCSGPGYMRNWYPREAFDKAIFTTFENCKLPVPVGYDDYLKIAFGDYMVLPPIEKRVGHHEAFFMDLSTSFIEYKGIYW